MTKSELIDQISDKYPDMTKKQVEFIVNNVFVSIKEALRDGGKVEVRGFGSFKLREKKEKVARNPKTGEMITVSAKKVPYFKPGKDMKAVLIGKSN